MLSRQRIPWIGALSFFALLQTPYSPLSALRSPNPLSGMYQTAGPAAADGVGAGPEAALDARTAPGAKGPRPQVIYGTDDRLDLKDVRDPALLALARSTAAMVNVGDLVPLGGGWSRLRGGGYGPSYNLCHDERFYDQLSVADCTGFLVAPDVIATAGHCVQSTAECRRNAWVFSFEIDGSGRDASVVGDDDVYACRALVGSLLNSKGSDWALVRLDRPAAGRAPLALRRSGKIQKGEGVTLIGHPAGLPKKIADGARVRAANSPAFFTAETDSYGGNSGSPVFNANTLEVEGILVRGEADFERHGSCMRSKVCAPGACLGESVTRVSEFLRRIPN